MIGPTLALLLLGAPHPANPALADVSALVPDAVLDLRYATARNVVGVVRNFTPRYPGGMARVILLGDPSKEVGSIAEPECRRIIAALGQFKKEFTA